MDFAASSPVELHRRWGGCCKRRERGREDRRNRGGKEKRKEGRGREGRHRLCWPRQSGFAGKEEKRKSGAALFFGEEEE
uniref:Uncharacterized protein n=1 Tax=Solanum tuberosum TaxID=4113 RepID=M1C8B6_SOLTU